jgi:hypothetical protein
MLNSMVRLQQNNLIYAMCVAENIQRHVPCNSVKPWLHFLITQLKLLEPNAAFASSDQKQRFEMLDLIGILKCTIKNSDLKCLI